MEIGSIVIIDNPSHQCHEMIGTVLVLGKVAATVQFDNGTQTVVAIKHLVV